MYVLVVAISGGDVVATSVVAKSATSNEILVKDSKYASAPAAPQELSLSSSHSPVPILAVKEEKIA